MKLFKRNAGIAEFQKVGYEEFRKAFMEIFENMDDSQIFEIFSKIKMPQRATKQSAGYDIYSTLDFVLKPGETMKIPTGIRCKMKEGWVLQIYPRSGLGFKYRLQLDNTTGIIDSDYYFSDNEGHIYVKVTNDSKSDKTVSIQEGMAFCQGIFVQYGTVVNDKSNGIRNGGFGSTTNKN